MPVPSRDAGCLHLQKGPTGPEREGEFDGQTLPVHRQAQARLLGGFLFHHNAREGHGKVLLAIIAEQKGRWLCQQFVLASRLQACQVIGLPHPMQRRGEPVVFEGDSLRRTLCAALQSHACLRHNLLSQAVGLALPHLLFHGLLPPPAGPDPREDRLRPRAGRGNQEQHAGAQDREANRGSYPGRFSSRRQVP